MIDRNPLIRVTAMPADTNPYGGMFGGWLMGQMALAAGSLASRHARSKAVVVAADNLRFPGAMAVGDELSVYCTITREGRTSILIRAEAIARDRNSDREFPVASGDFTMVAVDDAGKARAIEAAFPSPRSAGAESPSPAEGRGKG